MHEDLPKHALPHLPVRLAKYDGLPVVALCGVCSFDLFQNPGCDFLGQDTSGVIQSAFSKPQGLSSFIQGGETQSNSMSQTWFHNLTEATQ